MSAKRKRLINEVKKGTPGIADWARLAARKTEQEKRPLRPRPSMAEQERKSAGREAPVLVVAPAWVGDMVMAQSLFAVLKRTHPGRPLHVLSPAATQPLLAFMPEVDRAIALPLRHGQLGLASRYRLGRALRAERYDWAIVLPRAFKAALVPFFAGAERRTGYQGEARYGLINDARRDPGHAAARTIDRFLALAGAAGPPPAPRLSVPAETVRAALGALALAAPDGRLLALGPGAEFGPSKRWPAEHFAALARAWQAQGGAVWLIGGPGDRAASAAIAASAPGCLDLAGRTDLAQAVALLSLADAVVSNDSGLMHVAAALGRPQVALFGSSSPEITPPLSPHARALWLRLDCSPCFKRVCPLGHHRCLRDLTPAAVMQALQEVWAEAGSRAAERPPIMAAPMPPPSARSAGS
jgi:heptosyltransferase-2